MSTFKTFEEIDAWQEARKLIRAIRSLCKKDPVKNDFAFVDQITRSSRSIAANIAEGFESLSTNEFIRFLGHSKASCGETRSHLYDAAEEGYLPQEDFLSFKMQTEKISRMLAGLISYLNTADKKRKRITPRKPKT